MDQITEQDNLYKNQVLYDMKHDACMLALKITNSMISNLTYENVPDVEILKETIPTEKIRQCMDMLVVSCDTGAVVKILNEVLFGRFTPAIIQEMRQAVRRELLYGTGNQDGFNAYETFHFPPNRTFMAVTGWDKKKKQRG